MNKDRYTMLEFKNTMLISPNKVKNYGTINLNVNDSEIGNAIRIAQNVYLTDILGTEMVENIQELVYNKIKGSGETIDDYEQYKVLLDEYITPVLVYRTALELCTILSLKIRNMGVVKNNDTNVQATTAEDVKSLSEYYGTFFYDYVNKMMDFLCQNKGAFVELPDGFCSCKRKPKYARTALWLGK